MNVEILEIFYRLYTINAGSRKSLLGVSKNFTKMGCAIICCQDNSSCKTLSKSNRLSIKKLFFWKGIGPLKV